jgi:hypothetical protein
MTEDTNGLSREQVEARLRPAIAEAQACGYCDGSCASCREEAAALAPTVAAMLDERDRLARAEVARDVAAIPAPGPFDYLADWAQYRSLVLQAVARHMPTAVREGGTERRPAPGGSDGPQESAGPSDGRTGPQESWVRIAGGYRSSHGLPVGTFAVVDGSAPRGWVRVRAEVKGQTVWQVVKTSDVVRAETCGEALGDMRCQLRRGHDGDHEDYSAVAQERRA